jgi:hypothetical protein
MNKILWVNFHKTIYYLAIIGCSNSKIGISNKYCTQDKAIYLGKIKLLLFKKGK